MTPLLLWLSLLLAQSPGAPSQAAIPAIEPTWIYITPLHWKHAPRGFHLSSTPANIVVLYPEGQYFEVETALIKNDKGVFLVQGGTRLLQTGNWSRTDDRVIRIQSRVVFRNPPIAGQSLPEPLATETCGLEGKSPTHLAQTIHCPRLIFKPSHLDLDLSGLQRMAADAVGSDARP